MFSCFCAALSAQNYDNQPFNPPNSPSGEVGGQQNDQEGIVPIWIDDPEYALLADHEHQCLRCKAGRACKYREDSIERLALRYGAVRNQVDPYYGDPGIQRVGCVNSQNYYNGNLVPNRYYVPGSYTTVGGYDTYGAYGEPRQVRQYYNPPRTRLRWQVGVVFGN